MQPARGPHVMSLAGVRSRAARRCIAQQLRGKGFRSVAEKMRSEVPVVRHRGPAAFVLGARKAGRQSGEPISTPQHQSRLAVLFGFGSLFFVFAVMELGSSWRDNLTFNVDVTQLKEDVLYLFSRRPQLRTAVLHLLFKQNCSHIHGDRESDANTASLQHVAALEQHADIRDALADLAKLHQAYEKLSAADLWVFVACMAIEDMGGPLMVATFEHGRTDGEPRGAVSGKLLPKAERHGEAGCLRNLADFCRMNMTMEDMVALMGAHTVGWMHRDRTGYHGTWTATPEQFNNEYYRRLLSERWELDEGGAKACYRPASREMVDLPAHAAKGAKGGAVPLAMLPADVALVQNERTRKIVRRFAADEGEWHAAFKTAFEKMTQLGQRDLVRWDVGYSTAWWHNLSSVTLVRVIMSEGFSVFSRDPLGPLDPQVKADGEYLKKQLGQLAARTQSDLLRQAGAAKVSAGKSWTSLW